MLKARFTDRMGEQDAQEQFEKIGSANKTPEVFFSEFERLAWKAKYGLNEGYVIRRLKLAVDKNIIDGIMGANNVFGWQYGHWKQQIEQAWNQRIQWDAQKVS